MQTKIVPLSMLLDVHLPPMVVEGLLPEKGLILIQAEPGTGKSWLGLELGLSVASGTPVFGKRTVAIPGRVLYVASDSPDWDLAAQARKLMRAKGFSREDFDAHRRFAFVKEWEYDGHDLRQELSSFQFWIEPPPVLKSDVFAEHAEKIISDGDYSLVVVDTLMAMHEGPENDNAWMQVVMNRAKKWRKYAAIVCLTHNPKPTPGFQRYGTYKTRGAGVIPGGFDAILDMETRKDAVNVSVLKQRACPMTPFAFQIVDNGDETRLDLLDRVYGDHAAIVLRVLADGKEHGWSEIISEVKKEFPKATETTSISWTYRDIKELIADGRVKKPKRAIYVMA